MIHFDNIFIYSTIAEKHMEYISQGMRTLRWEKLNVNLKKCTWIQLKVIFLGFIVFVNDNVVD